MKAEKPPIKVKVTVNLEPEKHPANCARFVASLRERIRQAEKERKEQVAT